MKFKSGRTGIPWEIVLEESGTYLSTYYTFLEKLSKPTCICKIWKNKIYIAWKSDHLKPCANRARKLRNLQNRLHRN